MAMVALGIHDIRDLFSTDLDSYSPIREIFQDDYTMPTISLQRDHLESLIAGSRGKPDRIPLDQLKTG